MSDRPWRLGGFATGGYMNKCSTCSEVFTGDKRAITCMPCVVKHITTKLDALSTAEARVGELEREKQDGLASRDHALRIGVALDDAILEAMCRAHDAEDAAQMGEPSPWEGYSDLAVGDNAIWAGDRLASMRCAAEVLLSSAKLLEREDSRDDLATLRSQLNAALGALRPFAEPVEELDDLAPHLRAEDDMIIGVALFDHQQPTVGDMRRAYALLHPDPPSPEAKQAEDGR